MSLYNAPVILFPPVALAALTFGVFIRLYKDRISEMRSRRIHPQKVATSKQMMDMMQNTQASDNFKNLFEMPVLFYVVCGYAAITNTTTGLLLACAWGYVFLRMAHTYVHLTSNHVIRRFQLFFASSIVLFVMWVSFAVEFYRLGVMK